MFQFIPSLQTGTRNEVASPDVSERRELFDWRWICGCIAGLVLLAAPASAENDHSTGRYLEAAQRFADTVLEHGRDRFGSKNTPLFVDGLHIETLEPVRWKYKDNSYVLSNVASQQPLFRLLDGLTSVTGDTQYREAAEAAIRRTLNKLQTPNGLLYWGGHAAWDLKSERPVGQRGHEKGLIHEIKLYRPYYRLFWHVDAERTKQLLRTIWAAHIVDWQRLDYNRHADLHKAYQTGWDHSFKASFEVPFHTSGHNSSFVNVALPLLHSSVMAATLGDDTGALKWSRRLVKRWKQARHEQTGLSGGRLSWRDRDWSQRALGHVHPDINEAKIVASFHQMDRYHHLPLAQMQDGLALVQAGGKRAAAGRSVIHSAAKDLAIYARQCYDPDTNRFISMKTDGTPLQWEKTRNVYYSKKGMKPRGPDGFIFWAYTLAWRLTGNDIHWRMARRIARQHGLGDIGSPEGNGRQLNTETNVDDWQSIYALLELAQASEGDAFLDLASRVGDNLVETQTSTGLFLHDPTYNWSRTGNEAPLALLHLAAAIRGKREQIPAPAFDHQYFHAEFTGDLEAHQKTGQQWGRTYDNLVFYRPMRLYSWQDW